MNQTSPTNDPHRKSTRPAVFVGSTILCIAAVIGYMYFAQDTNGQFRGNRRAATQSNLTLADIPFDGQAAMQWVEKICQIGTRVSGSAGMTQQQKMLQEHFQSLGGQVSMQQFDVRHPLDGSRVPMANLIVQWHPERSDRIMLCAHYDTRPFPDRDPVDKRGVFLGANDGASGVAVLAVMGKSMSEIDSKLGVDFVLFDGEELVYGDVGQYFLGSEYFARAYAANPKRGFEYRAAVLLDMVGDKNLEIKQERHSLSWRNSRWINKTIWDKAKQLGVKEFIPKPYPTKILDDHIMLNRYGKIPACDIIDFSYRSPDRRMDYWHTREDTPDKCSALSLAKVGWVVHEWLKDEAKKRN